MIRRVAWFVFLIVGVIIGLGAFGHGYEVHQVHEAIDQFPINSNMHESLYMVWYFVSGAMLTFGLTVVWIAVRLRAGDASGLFASFLIGALYFIFGVWTYVYRNGDPFALLFVALGALLLGSSAVLRSDSSRALRG
ncbi:MAG: hypothetical protein WAK20_06000 [Candidatus Acidiferrum sp.]